VSGKNKEHSTLIKQLFNNTHTANIVVADKDVDTTKGRGCRCTSGPAVLEVAVSQNNEGKPKHYSLTLTNSSVWPAVGPLQQEHQLCSGNQDNVEAVHHIHSQAWILGARSRVDIIPERRGV
jgi:hypothetical protein